MENASARSIEIPRDKEKVYYKIRTVFPNISVDYIKDIVINPDSYGINNTMDDDQFINELTEHLLESGTGYDNDVHYNNHWQFETSPTADVQTDRLIGIFPDADPEFLKNFAEKNFRQPHVMNTFIEENLLQKSYPTRDEYVARKNIQKEFDRYFNKFDVEEFLKEFADPVKSFEGSQRICQEDKTVSSLLYELFQNVDKTTVYREYRNCKFNPSLTAKSLEENQAVIPKKFSTESIKLLEKHMQEFSYISNRKIIQEEMKKQEVSTKELTCETCFTDFTLVECSSCDNGHIHCNSCIRDGVQCYINDGIYTIKCFANCEGHFSQKTLQKVLSSHIYDILINKQLELELAAANIKNLESCPFCEFPSEVADEDKIFICMNEDCKKESCRECKKANHLPHECADVLELKQARIYVEEKLTKALVRACYKCQKEFIKTDGCNRMNCLCGAVMCYICDQPVPANDYKHFNGQGSDQHYLCPLYSDDTYQEAQAVLEVARITKEEILKKNPDFDLQIVDLLLPILPAKTSGPHDQIPNSNQIPEHALKVAKAISP